MVVPNYSSANYFVLLLTHFWRFLAMNIKINLPANIQFFNEYHYILSL